MLTTREVIKTFYNALVHKLKKYRGNWDQNDPNADDYIKNRPFYTDENEKVVIVPEQQIISNGNYPCFLDMPELIEFTIGQTYDVKWDDDTYHCVAFDLEGISTIGNQGFLGGSDTGEPFIMMISKVEGYAVVVAFSAGSYNVEVTTTKVVKLDKKYLPDLGLSYVAYSNNYWDLDDIPDTYEDVVRYGAAQNLTASQKSQARDNIGAGNFDGNYANLTNKPNILTTEVIATDHIFSFVQDEITSGRDIITVNGYKYYKISGLVILRENYVSCSGVYYNSNNVNNASQNKSADYKEFVYGENCLSPITGVIIVESVENGRCELPISSTFTAEFTAPSVGIYAMYDISYGKRYCQSIELHYQTKKPYLNAIPVDSGDGIFDIMVNEKGLIYTKDENGNVISSGSTSDPKESIALIDKINGNTYIICMENGNLVSYLATESI